MIRRLSAGLLLTLFVTLAAGCSRTANDPTLATVGDRSIKLSNYIEAWQGLPDQAKPNVETPEARLAFLNDLVNKDVMELEARRRSPELDDAQRRRLHRFAETQLLNQLTEVEINRKMLSELAVPAPDTSADTSADTGAVSNLPDRARSL